MDLKQSMINIGWKIDDSGLSEAKQRTDALIQALGQRAVDAAAKFNSAVSKSGNDLDRVNDKTKAWLTINDKISQSGDKIVESNARAQRSIDENLLAVNRLRTFSEDIGNKFRENAEAIKSMSSAFNNPLADIEKMNSKLSESVSLSKRLTQSIAHPISERYSANTDMQEKPARSKGSGIGSSLIGGAVGGLVGGAVAGVTGYIKEQAKAAYQADAAAQKVQLAWQTMGVKSTASVKSLTSQIGELTKQANISGGDTTAAQKNLYNATNGNIEQTKALTNEMFAFGKSTGLSNEQIVSATGSLGRLFNTAKVRGSAFTRVTKQMPAMREAIIKASGKSSAKFMADMNAGKISGTELKDLMVKAASQSGAAWEAYGKTAGGALAKLQGAQTQIWKDTMKGMAGDANQGLVQLSNLISKNTKPISQMMAGVGNEITKIANGGITFLVKNQKPLGEIAHDLISIAGTIGKGVWDMFSGVAKAIGDAFGLINGNSKQANNPLQITANLLGDIDKHKTAVKVVADAFVGMFMIKKANEFAASLRGVAAATGLIATEQQKAEGGSGLLNTLFQNTSSAGMFSKKFGNRASEKFNMKMPTGASNEAESAFKLSGKGSSLASNLSGGLAGASILSKDKQAFRSAKDISSVGGFGKFSKLAGVGATADTTAATVGGRFGLMGKLGGFGSKLAGSKLFTGATKIASKVPFLDVAAAGTQLIGINKHNVGGKIGSFWGMLGGSVAGAGLGAKAGALIGSVIPGAGTAAGAGIGSAVGGIAGGIGGSSVGKWIGKKVQGAIPKNMFGKIKTGWNDAISAIKKSSFAKTIGNDLKPVGKQFGSLWNSIKKTTSSVGRSMGKAFAPVGKAFGSMWKTIKPYAEKYVEFVGKTWPHITKFAVGIFKGQFKLIGGIVSSSFKIVGSVLSGAFKSIQGLFEVFSGVFTGNWKKTWTGVKDIFGGIFDAIGGTLGTIIDGMKNTLNGFFKGVGKFLTHPIQSIKEGLGFATGTNSRYPHGLPKATNAVVNDGTGPELIQFGNNFGMYKGRNVHTILPKGSHVYNAGDTRKMVGTQHFATGTTSLQKNKSSLFSMKLDTKKPNKDMRDLSTNLVRTNKKMQNNLVRDTKNGSKQVLSLHNTNKDNLIKVNDQIYKQLDPIWTKTTKAFGNDWSKLSGYSQSAMQGAVDELNKGISGIDKTLTQFGGNSSVLSPIHYANGTGAVDTDHVAMVNDSKQGQSKEAIIDAAGNARYARGTNALTMIHKGESVLNGTDTAEAIRLGLIPHYAKGKSSKSALRALAKKNSKDPKGAFNTEFTNSVKNIGSTLAKGLTAMGSNSSANDREGYNWSNAMWKVINSKIQGSPASGLLAAVEKYGTGHKYVWGATGPDSFDCSGLVQYALKHAFGIDYPRTSGEQIAKARSISKSDAEPGDLIGNSEHIGVVADKGANHYFSAFNDKSHPNILMTPTGGGYFPGTPHFGRVSGISNTSSQNKGLKGVSPMMKKLVESQLGTAALNNITKVLGDANSASGNPAGDGVQRWSPLVKKALGALHLSTDGSMVSRVLRQISTESGGNPDAVGGTDGLNDGRAMGLMQVKPGTFSAYGDSALGKWNNGYASIYAGLNYAKHRYGDSLSFLGNGHGYANGGRPPLHEPVLVGERGPEIVQFDTPARIKSNADSINQLRSKSGNRVNRAVQIAKGAINITVNGAGKNGVNLAKQIGQEVDKRVRSIFYNANVAMDN